MSITKRKERFAASLGILFLHHSPFAVFFSILLVAKNINLSYFVCLFVKLVMLVCVMWMRDKWGIADNWINIQYHHWQTTYPSSTANLPCHKNICLKIWINPNKCWLLAVLNVIASDTGTCGYFICCNMNTECGHISAVEGFIGPASAPPIELSTKIQKSLYNIWRRLIHNQWREALLNNLQIKLV